MGLTQVSSKGIKDATLLNEDVNASAAIAMSKLALSITNSEINASAAIAKSKIENLINNNADNRVITGSGTANTLNGESTLTYDGQALTLTSGYLAVRQGSLPQVDIQHSTDTSYSRLYLAQSSGSGGYFAINKIGTNGGAYSGGSNAVQLWSSANAPMLFATNNAERLRIDSSGNLTLGGFSAPTDLNTAQVPTLFIDQIGNNIFGEADALYISQNAYFNNSGSYERVATHRPLQYKQRLGKHKFLVGDSGSAGGNVTFSEAVIIDADGLKFNGDTAAANALNDYEEGTWTPTMTYSGGGSATLSEALGHYTKIGRFVNIMLTITCSAQGGGSGDVQFNNLPFQAGSTTGFRINGFATYATGFNSINSIPVLYYGGSGTIMQLFHWGGAGAASNMVNVTRNNITSSTTIRASINYYVD